MPDDITKSVKPIKLGLGDRLLSQAQQSGDEKWLLDLLKKTAKSEQLTAEKGGSKITSNTDDILKNVMKSLDKTKGIVPQEIGGEVGDEVLKKITPEMTSLFPKMGKEVGEEVGKKILSKAPSVLGKMLPTLGKGVLKGTLAAGSLGMSALAEAADSPEVGPVSDTPQGRFESGHLLTPEDIDELDRVKKESTGLTLEDKLRQRLASKGYDFSDANLTDLNIPENQPQKISEDDISRTTAEINDMLIKVRELRKDGVSEDIINKLLKKVNDKYSRLNKLRDKYYGE